MAGSSSATWQLGVSRKGLNNPSEPLGLTLSLISASPESSCPKGPLP